MRNEICDKLIRRENLVDGDYSYTYELTSRAGDAVATYGLPLYSVRICMTDGDGKSREANAKDIFSNHEKAETFFNKLVRNLATPIDLVYILEDEIG